MNPTGAPVLWSDFNEANLHAMLGSELKSWPVTMLILVIAFGALVSAGLPLVLTLAGLIASAGSLVLLTHFFPISIWAMNFAMMFSLALGVDYALFLVVRYRAARQQRSRPRCRRRDHGHGREGGPALRGDDADLAVGRPARALTVVPLGCRWDHAVGRVRPRRHADPASVGAVHPGREAQPVLPAVGPTRIGRSRGGSLLGGTALASTGGLGARVPGAAPRVRCSRARPPYGDAVDQGASGATPPRGSATSRPRTHSAPAPLACSRSWSTATTLAAAVDALSGDRDVAGVLPAEPPADGSAARSPPGDPDARALRSRSSPRPSPAFAQCSRSRRSSEVRQQRTLDLKAQLDRSTPWVVGVILVLGFLLLLLALQAPLVALLGTVVSLLSTAGAFGLARLVFQDGHGSGLLGFSSQGFVDAWAPVFFFAMIFAIAMDYTVFLLAAAKEQWELTNDPRQAMVGALARSGRVIFAAGGVMVAVFFTFALSGQLPAKEMGTILGPGRAPRRVPRPAHAPTRPAEAVRSCRVVHAQLAQAGSSRRSPSRTGDQDATIRPVRLTSVCGPERR